MKFPFNGKYAYDDRPAGNEPPPWPEQPSFATRIGSRSSGEWAYHPTLGQARAAHTRQMKYIDSLRRFQIDVTRYIPEIWEKDAQGNWNQIV